jgi:rSAM/selenodomain-associated transferase 2
MISTRVRIHSNSRGGQNPIVELAVIIPTLNEEQSIAACIESVGTTDEIDVVVVDGGSSDRTVERARMAGARVVESPPGRGPQLNFGADSTAAARLLFLHADCLLPEGWLQAVSRALDDEEVSLACFRLRTISSAMSEPSWLYRWSLRFFDLRSFGLGLPYGDQGFSIRHEIFDRVGRFPEIPLMEDVAFAHACRREGTLRRLPIEIVTTARRVERRPLRTGLMLAIFPTLYRLGVAPQTLARWYGSAR